MHRINIELEDGVFVLTCPQCSFEKRYYSTENRLDTINEGDVYAVHCGGMGGLEIASVDVRDPRLDVFEEFFDEQNYGT